MWGGKGGRRSIPASRKKSTFPEKIGVRFKKKEKVNKSLPPATRIQKIVRGRGKGAIRLYTKGGYIPLIPKRVFLKPKEKSSKNKGKKNPDCSW